MQVRDQVQDVQLKNLLIPQNKILQQLKMRLSWLFLFLISPFVLPVGILKALGELFTGQPKRALKTFGSHFAGSMGLMFVSLISIFFPSLVKKIVTNIFSAHKDNLFYEKKILRLILKFEDGIKNNYKVKQFSVENIETISIQSKAEKTDKYVLYFCGQGYSYQKLTYEMELINYFEECNLLKRKIIAFNYPGSPNSIVDFINAGFLEVLHLIQIKKWSRKDTEKHLQLYGHSLGGAIALQVALLLKQTLQVDVPVHVDRSFSSITDWMKEHAAFYFNISRIMAKIVSFFLLKATGGWELNSVQACKKLNPKMIHYYNIGHLSDLTVRENETFLDKVKTLIYGDKEGDAEPIIRDGATLVHGLRGRNSRDIFKNLNIHHHAHVIYPINGGMNPHVIGKRFFHELKSNNDFLMLYKMRVESHDNQHVNGFKLHK